MSDGRLESRFQSGGFDSVCDQFEQAWKACRDGTGPHPCIEDFLAQTAEPLRLKLFEELLHLELAYRRQQKERPTIEEYVSRIPDQADSINAIFGRLPLQAGDLLGDYELVGVGPNEDQPLGRGGMGEVWKACHRIADNTVALKVIKPKFLSGKSPDERENAIQRFYTEVRAAAALEHDHIVRMYYVGEHNGQLFYTMQFIDGDSLESLVQAHRPTQSLLQPDASTVIVETPNDRSGEAAKGKRDLAEPLLHPRKAAHYIAKAAQAIQFAHNRGIFHRDIKPANILIEKETDRAFVADFGLARLLELDDGTVAPSKGSTEDHRLTRGGMGTLGYMAPEQASDAKQATAQSDIYGLGATLCALLTGQPPRKPAKSTEKLSQVFEDHATITSDDFHVECELEYICLKCLQEEPGTRYGSAKELTDALQCYLDNRLVPGVTYSKPQRVWRWCKRNPSIAGLTVAMAISLVAGTIISTSFAVSAIQERDRANEKTAEAVDAQRDAEQALQESQRQMARNYIERGVAECEAGRRETGLVLLLQAYKAAPNNDPLRGSARRLLAGWSDTLGACVLQIGRENGLILPKSYNGTSASQPNWGKLQCLVLNESTHQAWVWDISSEHPIKELPITELLQKASHAYSAQNMNSFFRFSPDMSKVFIVDDGGTARLWNAETGQSVGEPLELNGPVQDVLFSPDGKKVIITSRRTTETEEDILRYVNVAQMWNAETGKPIGQPLRQEGSSARVSLLPTFKTLFSPDGKNMVITSQQIINDNETMRYVTTAQLRDVETGKPVGEEMRHAGTVWEVAFNPDGTRVLTKSDDTVRLWNVETGEPLGEPMRHENDVNAVVFSPDGAKVLTQTSRALRLWNAETGRLIWELVQHEGTVQHILFSPNGTKILTGSDDGIAQLWDTQTGQPIGEPMRHGDAVRAVTFSPDGTKIFTGSDDNTARLWEAENGRPIGEPLRHESPVHGVLFSPDGTKIITNSLQDRGFLDFEGSIRLWDIGSANPPPRIGVRIRELKNVAAWVLSDDGKKVATISDDYTVGFWNSQSLKPIGKPLRHEDKVWDVVFSPDWTKVVTQTSRALRLWNAETGRPIGEPVQHEGTVQHILFSPNGEKVIITSRQIFMDGTDIVHYENIVRLWNAKTCQPIGAPIRHEGSTRRELEFQTFNSSAFSPDGMKLLTYVENSARLWDAQTGRPIGEPMRHEGEVKAVAFSPDGATVLTGSSDNTARLWNAQTGKPLGTPLRHKSEVEAVGFSPDGNKVLTTSRVTRGLFSGGEDMARLWDTQTGRPVSKLMWHDVPIQGLSILWGDYEPFNELKRRMLKDYRNVVAFSSDGKMLFTRNGKTVQLWDTTTGNPIGEPIRHDEPVSITAFTRDPTILLTTSAGTTQLWDAATCKPIGEPIRGGHKEIVGTVPDDPERIRLWVEVLTGRSYNDGIIQSLSFEDWIAHRKRLDALGGPPKLVDINELITPSPLDELGGPPVELVTAPAAVAGDLANASKGIVDALERLAAVSKLNVEDLDLKLDGLFDDLVKDAVNDAIKDEIESRFGKNGSTLYTKARAFSTAAMTAPEKREISEVERNRMIQNYSYLAVMLLVVAEKNGYFDSEDTVKKLKIDPAFDPIRSHEQFKELMQSLDKPITLPDHTTDREPDQLPSGPHNVKKPIPQRINYGTPIEPKGSSPNDIGRKTGESNGGQPSMGRLRIYNPGPHEYMIYINGKAWRARVGWSYVPMLRRRVGVTHITGAKPVYRDDWTFDSGRSIWTLTYDLRHPWHEKRGELPQNR